MEKVSTFCERLNEAMARNRMSQKDLADDTGMDISRICHYVQGRNGPKHEGAVTLARALNVDVDWLLGYDVPMTKKREGQLTDLFDQLNEIGKMKAEEYISDLLENPKYQNPIVKRKIA